IIRPVFTARPKATVTIHPANPVFTGETVTLTCHIGSGDGWYYEWFKDSNPLSEAQQGKEYTISNVAESHRGDYTCKGRQSTEPRYSETSDAVTLTVSERPKPAVSIQPDDQVFIGETVTLRCDIQGGGVSKWQYSWFKDDPNRPVSNEQQYSISSVTESHRGKYTCRGTERGTSRYSHTSDVTLTVSALPTATLTVEPRWSPVFTGESVTLKCEIQSHSDWRYQWYKGSSGTAVSESQTNTVTIRSAADQGQYWCRGERDNRPSSSQPSNTVTLTVKERPKPAVSIQPDDQVFRGETVTLTCDIQGGGVSNWQYSWFKDGSSTAVSNEQQYNISSVTESHSGSYTCIGTVSGTSRNSHTSDAATLTVSDLPKPTLTVEPERPVFSGESVTLKCEIKDYDGWTYQWYKQDKQSGWTAVSQSDYHTVDGDTLTIRGDTVINGDQYLCRGERHDRPTSEYSNSVTLTVEALPPAELTVEPKQSPVFSGESVTLKCKIKGYDGWTYRWYKHDKQSELTAVSQSEHHTVNGDTLTIRADTVINGEQYWCRGERRDRPTSSQYSSSVTLTVNALPTAKLTEPRWSPVFTGESVTLKCEIQSHSNWRYQWYKGSSGTAVSQSQTNTFTIRSAADQDQDQYWCRGERDDRPSSSQLSNTVTLRVKGKLYIIITAKFEFIKIS
uniref:Ig-like domain-containing protein n=1 Tax=Pygocentrus nattereri TaxID=42514 RepID=A0AAR2M1W9_PYGNA